MLNSPCQRTGPLHSRVGDQPPGFHLDSNVCPALLEFPPHLQKHLSEGFAAQLGLTAPYGGWRVFCSVPPSECSTLCSAGPQLSVVNWQQRGEVRGPSEAEPKPAGPASEQANPGDDMTKENIWGSYMDITRLLNTDTFKLYYMHWIILQNISPPSTKFKTKNELIHN